MSEVLQEPFSVATVKAFEENFDALWSHWHCSPRVQAREEGGLTWYETGVASPFLNTIWRTQLTPETADARIEAMREHFRSCRLTLTWYISSRSRPVDMGRRLEAHGFVGEHRGMAVDLCALNESLPYPAGLVIERVSDGARMRQWADVFAIGFDMPAVFGDGVSAIESAFGFGERLPCRMYLGLLDGKAVATSYLLLGGGVAGIYCVATVPEARRRGIGAALTLHALRAGRAMGYRVGVLGATEMGYPVYQRIGFREVETMMMTYVWDGASP